MRRHVYGWVAGIGASVALAECGYQTQASRAQNPAPASSTPVRPAVVQAPTSVSYPARARYTHHPSDAHVPACAHAGTAIPLPAGFPHAFPLPPGSAVTSWQPYRGDRRRIVISGIVPSPDFVTTVRFFIAQLPRAGFRLGLGDGETAFEPVTASDPDAGNAGKLWIDVLPIPPHSTPRQVLPIPPHSTPRQVLLQPFVDSDYPQPLLLRMRVAPAHLGGRPAYRLVTLPSSNGHQVSMLLARWRGRYYRVTIFGAVISPEAARVLATWRFVAPRQVAARGTSLVLVAIEKRGRRCDTAGK